MAVVQPVDMAVKASEILARFRPIAPRPALPSSPPPPPAAGQPGDGGAATRLLCHLQARPCRARKRARPGAPAPAVSPPPAAGKRKRALAAPPLRCAAATTDAVVATATRVHVSVSVPGSSACLPLQPSLFSPASVGSSEPARLSPEAAEGEEGRDVPVERDLLRKLLEPKVISPRAVRPVGSTIHVESVVVVVHGAVDGGGASAAAPKTRQDLEAELESDALPAVVTDSGNRVRLVNDAYKKMVGQPECPWLDAVGSAAAAVSRRISGEVALVVPEAAPPPPESHVGFSCTAKIEWERDGKRASIRAPCDVSRLHCEPRDYLFTWRFRTGDASVGHLAGGDA